MVNNHIVHSLYRIQVTATSVMGLMKMGNIAPRAGIEPTSLAFQVNGVTITPPRLPDVTTLPSPIYLCGSLPERSVQTTTITITPPTLPDVITSVITSHSRPVDDSVMAVLHFDMARL